MDERKQGYIESTLSALGAVGESNALKWDDIRKRIGASEIRYLQKQAEAERLNGAMILSSRRGVFLPSEDAETGRAEIRRYMGHNGKIISALSKINRSLSLRLQITGQQRIDDRGAE